mmetsp:Transcript_102696/g.203900  ORF Transcript_102696/g.203900 Transcript_102696/m.203900 type:complete len:251 (-) Transcript_102696:107-859(-)
MVDMAKIEQLLQLAIGVIMAVAVVDALCLCFFPSFAEERIEAISQACYFLISHTRLYAIQWFEEYIIPSSDLFRNLEGLVMIGICLYLGILGMQQRNKSLLGLFCCCNGANACCFGLLLLALCGRAIDSHWYGRQISLLGGTILVCAMLAARLVATATSYALLTTDIEAPQPQTGAMGAPHAGSARTPSFELRQQQAMTTGVMAQPIYQGFTVPPAGSARTPSLALGQQQAMTRGAMTQPINQGHPFMLY